jgi:hypothetical protein
MPKGIRKHTQTAKEFSRAVSNAGLTPGGTAYGHGDSHFEAVQALSAAEYAALVDAAEELRAQLEHDVAVWRTEPFSRTGEANYYAAADVSGDLRRFVKELARARSDKRDPNGGWGNSPRRNRRR